MHEQRICAEGEHQWRVAVRHPELRVEDVCITCGISRPHQHRMKFYVERNCECPVSLCACGFEDTSHYRDCHEALMARNKEQVAWPH